jgi:hypothetical protein
MATAAAEPDTSPDDAPPRRITPLKVFLALLVVAMVGMWVYALGPWARRDPPGRLDDPAFAAQAEPVCAAAADELAALPQAYETTTPQARAAAIDETNVVLTTMIADLRDLAPTEGADAERIGDWLDDWEVYIDDRQALADELATGVDARLHETARGEDHISQALDFFAENANHMPSCATPDDLS